MFDPASITALVHSVKLLGDLGKSINSAQISGQVDSALIDIRSKLLTLGEQALELQADNQQLRTEVETLKANARVVFEGNARWEHLQDGTVDGPLCDACWGFLSKRIHMQRDDRRNATDYVSYYCNHHDKIVVDSRVPKRVLEKYKVSFT
jgi:hypothetical protein